MELRLFGKTQTGAGIERVQWSTSDLGHIVQPGAVRSFQLTVKEFFLVVAAEEEVAIQSLEIAVDLLGRDNFLDLCNGRGVALRCESRSLCAVKALDLGVAVIDGIREVRSEERRVGKECRSR